MAEKTVANTVENVRSLLGEYAQTHGWPEGDYAVSVEAGEYGDVRIRFGAKALEQGPKREEINREIWDFLRSHLPQEEFGRISLFGGSGLVQFQSLYPEVASSEKV